MNAVAHKDPWENRERPEALIRKTAEVASLLDSLREEIARLQGREAVTRTTMVQVLLAAAAERAVLRAERLAGFAAARQRHAAPRASAAARLLWRLRKPLFKTGALGQTLLVAAFGAWRWGPGLRGIVGGLLRIYGYVSRGADPRAEPLTWFDQAWYLSCNPDVAASGASPLAHYLVAGQFEGRDPHPLFATRFYAEQNAEALAQARRWPLAHFLRTGPHWRDPHPLFDSAHYLAQGPNLEPGDTPASHYLREGWRLGLSPHPLFDGRWYLAQAPGAAGSAPLAHYLETGAAAGLSPHPLFDPAWYLEQLTEPADAAADPLRHYLAVGATAGLSPSPFFDSGHYAARRGEALPAGANPLLDYLQAGAWSVGEPAPAFATSAYVAAHPELAAQGLTPLEHWARTAAERRQGD